MVFSLHLLILHCKILSPAGSTAHFIDEATVTHGNNGVVLSSTPGEVGLPNSGVCTDWGLVEQVMIFQHHVSL